MKAKKGPAKGNDQKPKPKLGNSTMVHGITSVDSSGGPGTGPIKRRQMR